MAKDLVVVDCDLIRRLKNEGRYEEAYALLRAHQKSIRNNFANFKYETHLIYNKIYRVKNPDKIKEGKKKWRLENPDKVREYNRKRKESLKKEKND